MTPPYSSARASSRSASSMMASASLVMMSSPSARKQRTSSMPIQLAQGLDLVVAVIPIATITADGRDVICALAVTHASRMCLGAIDEGHSLGAEQLEVNLEHRGKEKSQYGAAEDDLVSSGKLLRIIEDGMIEIAGLSPGHALIGQLSRERQQVLLVLQHERLDLDVRLSRCARSAWASRSVREVSRLTHESTYRIFFTQHFLSELLLLLELCLDELELLRELGMLGADLSTASGAALSRKFWLPSFLSSFSSSLSALARRPSRRLRSSAKSTRPDRPRRTSISPTKSMPHSAGRSVSLDDVEARELGKRHDEITLLLDERASASSSSSAKRSVTASS